MMTDQFDKFSEELGQCDWYSFPIGAQRMYVIFTHNAQQDMCLSGYGNIRCSLQTMKTVIPPLEIWMRIIISKALSTPFFRQSVRVSPTSWQFANLLNIYVGDLLKRYHIMLTGRNPMHYLCCTETLKKNEIKNKRSAQSASLKPNRLKCTKRNFISNSIIDTISNQYWHDCYCDNFDCVVYTCALLCTIYAGFL